VGLGTPEAKVIAVQDREGGGDVGSYFASLGKCLAASVMAAAGCAYGGDFSVAGGNGNFSLQMSYALAMRVKNPADGIINTPPDPLIANLGCAGPCDPNSLKGIVQNAVRRFQYPQSANYDDGDRNFKSGSLVNNRISALAELNYTRDNYGAQLRSDVFIDGAYLVHNDNDSPGTVNKVGSNTEFTSDTHRFDGRRIRLLDAYGYGSWTLPGDMNLNVRIGRQVVAWGESLYFPNISSALAPADATKATVPGADVKSILLPVNQVSLQMAVTERLTVLGEYKLEFKPTEINPVGEFFSIADVVGPGAQFAYGLHNPLPTLFPGQFPGAPSDISDVRYIGELRPSTFGQYGVGLKYEVTRATTIGMYRIRYHDTNPSPYQNYDCHVPLTGPNASGQILDLCSTYNLAVKNPSLTSGISPYPSDLSWVPATYNIRYFAGIDMSALSFSTSALGLSWAGDLSYRQHTPALVNYLAPLLGNIPVPMRSDVTQANLNAIYGTGSGPLWDSINVAAELGYVFVNHTDPYYHTMDLPPSVATNPAPSTQLKYSRTSWAGSVLVQIGENGVFSGWDLVIPITLAGVPVGQTSQLSSFGSLMGAGDVRASIGTTFTRMQVLDLGLVYSAYFGHPDNTTHPYADRDNIGLNATYRF
jgi:hypothetical protein